MGFSVSPFAPDNFNGVILAGISDHVTIQYLDQIQYLLALRMDIQRLTARR